MSANPTLVLTVASIKMWLRDRQALFWNLFLPLLIMGIFGVLNFGALGRVKIGVVDLAASERSQTLVERLGGMEAINIVDGGTLEDERRALEDGDRDLVLVLPPGFGATEVPWEATVLLNEARPAQVQVGQGIIRQEIDDLALAAFDAPRLSNLRVEAVDSQNVEYIDFLLPGIIAMSIMQMGLFSVAFGFVNLKQRGILRRLRATPVNPMSFLFAQVVVRLIVSVLQTMLLVGVAVVAFDVKILGSFPALIFLALLGGAVFISIGFAVSGWAKNENVAAPLANVVALPMMFLSGVFFGRDAMPAVLQSVTGYLPLTYLAEGMRSISAQGLTLSSQWINMVGLLVWLAVSFVVASRLFRWE